MKKVLLTMLTLLAAGSMWAQTAGPLNVPTVTRSAGQVKEVSVVASRNGVIKIQLETQTAYRDLQFDLTLPTGISLVTPAGEAVITDADNMVDEHHVAFYAQDGQTVKFAIVDNVALLAANTGIGEVTNPENYAQTLVTNSVILEIPVTVASDYSGSNAATLANVIASTEDANGVKSNILADATFNIRAMLLGDVNDDGDVDVQDITTLIDKIQGNELTVFVEVAADIDEEGHFDVQDISGVVDIIQTQNSTSSPAKAIIMNEESEIEPE